MHSSTFAPSGISRSRTVLAKPVNGERNWPEWITFRPHSSETQVSPTLTSLDHHVMLRGEEDEEGNALPRRLATFCAILSNLLHEVPSCRPTQNGLDGELTPELTRPGVIFPPHIGPN